MNANTNQPPPQIAGHDPAVPYSYRDVLERRLRTVDDAMAEYFDDRSALVHGVRDPYRATPDMSSFISVVEKLPVATGHAVFHEPKKIEKARKVQTLSSIQAQMQIKKTDKAILTRDIVIVSLSITGILLTLLSTLMSWYLVHVPNMTSVKTFQSGGCKQVFPKNGSITTLDWYKAMQCPVLMDCYEMRRKNTTDANTACEPSYKWKPGKEPQAYLCTDTSDMYSNKDILKVSPYQPNNTESCLCSPVLKKAAVCFNFFDNLQDKKDTYASYIRLVNLLVFASSLSVVGALIDYYRQLRNQKIKEWSRIVMYSKSTTLDKTSKPFNFMRSNLLIYFLLEVSVHCIFPYPWLEENYVSVENGVDFLYAVDKDLSHPILTQRHTRELLELMMLLRLYVVLRLMHHVSKPYKYRYDIIQSDIRMTRNNYAVTFGDSMKLYLNNYTVKTLLGAHILITTTGGFALFLLERDNKVNFLQGKLDEFANAAYTMFVSIRTIGYGDMKAVSLSGRIATFIFSVLGISVEMLLGSVVVNQFAMSKDETIVNEFLKSNTAWCEYRVMSAMLIQAAWKSSIKYKYLRGLVNKSVYEDYRKRIRERKRQKTKNTKEDAFDLTKQGVLKYTTFASDEKPFDHTSMDRWTGKAGYTYNGPKVNADGTVTVSQTAALKDLGYVTKSQQSKEFRQLVAQNRRLASSKSSSLAPLKYNGVRPQEPADIAEKCRQVIASYKQHFHSDIDVKKFQRSQVEPPPGFRTDRTFSASRMVTSRAADGTLKKRRVPKSDGHKSNILLEALKNFRTQRRVFKDCLTVSSDSVLEEKLTEIYQVLTSIVDKLQGTRLCMMNLEETTRVEMLSLKEYLRVEMGAVRREKWYK